ncbi:MAG: aminotransferase class V-fold PLP-dependent enzyme [Dokdonella sp.]|jgi:cystathionine beta-lyase/cystathionine gamma-synthase|uniref:trans-sulfuration enzyme family protein n=1 Tax=Dokdonella sp. TaxID=2291710 RepID=UPI001B4548BA|nr:PLP-dependent transferase [Dokdonella sp.]MBK8122030.1 aminotransferase class V-fold PLP-dependent enzyme [Dokdonella sp.]MBP6326543.1 aminotransferase class V-fold PLP-dependent enzyme [Dokdonella sp.]MBP6328520.1 aminotransferase class V-fold PLP-dependent enzyme [Dokdonella sp.]HQV50574.1 PLP-dependent transferase [Dokdonella sp.]
MDISHILNHLGEVREHHHGAVAPPLVQSSIFAFPSVADMRAGFTDEYAGHVYTRGNNPTVAILRQKVAALEGSEDCLAFGSGAAAIAAGVVASVRSGDHVVCVAKPYTATRKLLSQMLPGFGVNTSFVDARSAQAVEQALLPHTRLIVLESPNSMTFEQQDLAAISALARPRGIRTLCDNSFSSPLNQSPIAMGIDLVAHSATKYLNGHSDVIAGVLCGTRAMLRDVFNGPYMNLGAILSPHDAWLLIRGLRTLEVRMERVAATTGKVLAFLQAHPRVRGVFHPHAQANPQLNLSERQLRGASGLLSIDLDVGSVVAVERFCNALKRFLMTVSWGGYESLAFPVCAVFPADSPLRPAGGVPLSLVRLSIGLEAADLLIADLAQALAGMGE